MRLHGVRMNQPGPKPQGMLLLMTQGQRNGKGWSPYLNSAGLASNTLRTTGFRLSRGCFLQHPCRGHPQQALGKRFGSENPLKTFAQAHTEHRPCKAGKVPGVRKTWGPTGVTASHGQTEVGSPIALSKQRQGLDHTAAASIFP